MYMCKHINTHRYLLTPDTTFQPNLHNYGYISGYRQPTQIHTLSFSFLSLSLSTRTHTCSYTHTRLMMMMSVDNRLKSTIMRPWKFSSLRLWRVATLRMSRSWNLVCQFPTLHHLQWSWSSHSMWPIHSSYFSNLLLTGLSMLPFYLVHTLASAYLVAQTQHTRVLLIVLSP